MGWNTAWSADASYSAGDVVRHGKDVFKCLSATTPRLFIADSISDEGSDWDRPSQASDWDWGDGCNASEKSGDTWSSALQFLFTKKIVGGIKALYRGDDSNISAVLIESYNGTTWDAQVSYTFTDNVTHTQTFSAPVETTKLRLSFHTSIAPAEFKLYEIEGVLAPSGDPTHWQKLTGCGFVGNL
jgi:hypothetical protein